MSAVARPSRQQLPVKPGKPRSRQPAPGQRTGGAQAATTTLGHFDEIATMIALLEHSPELAGKIREWRPQKYAERLAAGAAGVRDDEILRAYGALSPLMQRAFRAVVEGIDKLQESAADLYGHAQEPPTPDQVKAGEAIGRSLRVLLERAMALVESPGGGSSAARLHRDPRSRQS
jgi:hypothetical protein